jgi:glycosyltransferase involved in cell wall biosynthesis
MASGAPVAISNVSVMPEIGGEAAVYANPYDAHAIGEAIYKIIQNENLRQNLIKKGLERAKFFSWKKTAKETISLYEKLLNS